MILERSGIQAQSVICRAEIQGKSGFIFDSAYDKVSSVFSFPEHGQESYDWGAMMVGSF